MSTGDKKNNTGINLRSRLKAACEGLNYMSETDSDLTPVFGKKAAGSTTQEVLSAIGVAGKDKIETGDADNFFSRLASHKEWFTEEQKENADRFGALKNLLDGALDDLKVYRIGKIRIQIYVLGVDKNKKVAGVKMNAIET
jgi:hypothetical protein